MVSSLTWNSQLLYQANGGTSTRSGFKERGVGCPEREVTWSPVGGTNYRIYRDVTLKGKVYEVDLWINAASKSALDDEIAQWEAWHRYSLGECVLQRVTAGGDTLCLDAVALSPQWGEQFGSHAIPVTQAYVASYPFWRSASESSASESWTTGGPQNISCTNAGTEPSWARIVLSSGLYEDPKIENCDGDYVEMNIDVTNTGDELEIVCKPHAQIVYTPSGGSATNYYGYRTAGSKFWRVPTGTHNVVVSSASGYGTCTVYWYTYRESLT